MRSRSERFVRKTLRKLARQRVAATLPPLSGFEPVWVIERAVDTDDEDTVSALRTCYMRGWAEPLGGAAVPSGRVDAEGNIPPGLFTTMEPVYRLTSSGWDVIRGTHAWLVATFLAAFLAVLVGLFGLFLTVRPVLQAPQISGEAVTAEPAQLGE